MNLTITKLKHAAFASEETNCVKATICLDGKAIGTLSNSGHGGSTNVDYNPTEIRDRVRAFIDGLPPYIADPKTGITTPMKMTEDLFFDLLVEKELKAKEDIKFSKKQAKSDSSFIAKCIPGGFVPFRVSFTMTNGYKTQTYYFGSKDVSTSDQEVQKIAKKLGSMYKCDGLVRLA